MNPTLNGSSEIQHFERSDTFKIRNKVIFVFYPGLPHILLVLHMRGRIVYLLILSY